MIEDDKFLNAKIALLIIPDVGVHSIIWHIYHQKTVISSRQQWSRLLIYPYNKHTYVDICNIAIVFISNKTLIGQIAMWHQHLEKKPIHWSNNCIKYSMHGRLLQTPSMVPFLSITWSQRCGMSINACVSWALNSCMSIISAVEFNVLHGDTDSFTFCLQSDKLGMSSFKNILSKFYYKTHG